MQPAIIELDLTNDPNPNAATTPAFDATDISEWVRGFSIRRGRSQELQRTEAGTATLLLDNRDRRFDPTYSAGPYFGNLRIMRRVRISAEVDNGQTGFTVGSSSVGGTDVLGSTITLLFLFAGHVESFPQGWEDPDAVVQVTCVDMFRAFALDTIDVSSSAETAGARINRILNERAYTERVAGSAGTAQSSPGRNITGEVSPGTWIGGLTLQAKTYTAEGMLGAMQEAADSEGGIFYIARDGKITYLHRRWAEEDINPLDTSLLWGDSGAELPYRYGSMVGGLFEDIIYNLVTVTAPSLSDQGASDTTSQARYFNRPFTLATILSTTGDMSTRADAILARFKEPALRIRSIQVSPVPDADWTRILGRDIWDKIVVRRRPPGGGTIEQESLIESITIDSPNSVEWNVTWGLSAV